MSTKTPGAKELRAMIDNARSEISKIPAGRSKDLRTARLDIEAARLFPTNGKGK